MITPDIASFSASLLTAAGTYARTVAEANIQLLNSSLEATRELTSGVLGDSARDEAEAFTVEADILPTPASLTVNQFIPRNDTPGNVAVCLSGGGSRAMIAAMGQLRALKALGLLGKVKALSTVSGGSWAAVPFTYLPEGIPEDSFLNEFVADPGELSLSGLGQSNKAARLDYLPPGNLGHVCANTGMSISSLEVQALDLLLIHGLSPVKLWSRLIGDNVLGPFGLAQFDKDNHPVSFFAYNEEMADSARNRNPSLPRRAHVYRQPSRDGETVRPLHICNASMFIKGIPGMSVVPDGLELLAPLHSTAFFTGILGSNLGSDSSDQKVGGGLLSSYAFGGSLEGQLNSNQRKVRLRAPFALSDITGMSSAFYASQLAQSLPQLSFLDPTAIYWPVSSAAPAGSTSKFADGGDLEDNGVASVLAFDDIDRLIVFINSTPMSQDRFGNIEVEMWLPTLFGFAPYRKGNSAGDSGYFLYKDMASGDAPAMRKEDVYFQHNQVFPSSAFQPMLDALWANSGSGSNENPAVFYQPGLDVLPNSWFHVRGGRKVDVLWFVLNPVESWVRQLRDEVEGTIPGDFPNYNIIQVHQSAVHVNLMSSLTAWTVHQQAGTLAMMFTPGGAGSQ